MNVNTDEVVRFIEAAKRNYMQEENEEELKEILQALTKKAGENAVEAYTIHRDTSKGAPTPKWSRHFLKNKKDMSIQEMVDKMNGPPKSIVSSPDSVSPVALCVILNEVSLLAGAAKEKLE